MVGFRDLVGTGIAPVSKKTAVKAKGINKKCNWKGADRKLKG